MVINGAGFVNREPLASIQQEVIQICCQVEGVYGLHDLRTRQAGPMRFIQLHLELDDHLPLVDAHSIVEAVEQKLHEHFTQTDIIIHMDPLSTIDAQVRYSCPSVPDPSTTQIK